MALAFRMQFAASAEQELRDLGTTPESKKRMTVQIENLTRLGWDEAQQLEFIRVLDADRRIGEMRYGSAEVYRFLFFWCDTMGIRDIVVTHVLSPDAAPTQAEWRSLVDDIYLRQNDWC